jgi:hypothetical protein
MIRWNVSWENVCTIPYFPAFYTKCKLIRRTDKISLREFEQVIPVSQWFGSDYLLMSNSPLSYLLFC